MKISIQGQKERAVQVICNGCGKRLPVSGTGIVMEDYLHVDKTWGYFSEQDGQKISFDLCEDCTRRLIRTFEVPVYQEEASELI